MDNIPEPAACCRPAGACAFDKALLARTACCRLAQRCAHAEGEWIACSAPDARIDCSALVALLRERSAFALKLPRGPMRHAQALHLQCGGIQALRNAVQSEDDDVRALVVQAQRRWGSLLQLPWAGVVRDIAAWQPRRHVRPGP